MNLNLSYQYISVIFSELNKKNERLQYINNCKMLISSTESKLKSLQINDHYSGEKLNKKILNNNKIITETQALIDEVTLDLENDINVKLMSYLCKLYYINSKLFNQGKFILENSLSLDTKIEDEKIASFNFKFRN
jgi:hypothetical protein